MMLNRKTKNRIRKALSCALAAAITFSCFTAAAYADTSKNTASLTGMISISKTTNSSKTTTETKTTLKLPSADGKKVEKNSLALIDYSNTSDGYIMAKYTGKSSKVKISITQPDGVAQVYNLRTDGEFDTFSLPDGNGTYSVLIAENVKGNAYAQVAAISFKVKLSSETAPFEIPNQYVNYDANSLITKKAASICKGKTDMIEKVNAVYTWIVENVTYDKKLAQTVASGHLPDLDRIVNDKKGICLDYAGAMTAMLRSQGVPTKLIVGYAGEVYHAWISVYSEETGWVYNVIYFDGKDWHRMDPTFAATANSSKTVMKYIGTGSNYSAKYIY